MAAVHDAGGDGCYLPHDPPVDDRARPLSQAGTGRLLGALLAANLCAVAVLAVPQVAPDSGTIGAAEPVVLQPGQPIVTSLAGGETRVYAFDLAIGHYARAEVEQRGIDVVATLISPQGDTVVEADGPDGVRGTERASALAETADQAGRFRLEVQSLDPSAPAGEIAVVLAAEREASPDDGDRLDAERAGYAAVALWGRGDPDLLPRAIAHYEEALAIWRRLDERRYAAEAATQLGYLHRNLGQTNRSAEDFELALELWRELGETARENEMLRNLARAYAALGDSARALAAATEAVEACRRLGNRHDEAVALGNLGLAHLAAGSPLELAEQAFAGSLRLNRELGDRSGEASALANLGTVQQRRGEMKEAIDKFESALTIAREIGDREVEAPALNNLAVAFEITGELARSLVWYDEVLRLVREQGDARGEAYALSNIGNLYQILGEQEEGLHYLQQALESFLRIGDRPAQARTLDTIGHALIALDRPAEAVETIERGLAIARAVGNKGQESAGLDSLARARQALGDGERALALAEQALAVARDAGLRHAEGTALRVVGEIRLASGEPAAAIDPLRGALAIQTETGSRPAEAETLLRLARAERELGRLDDARRDLEAAVERIESVRSAVATQDLRSTYLASKHEYYEEWVDLLMAIDRRRPGEGWDARAFAVAERARARTLLDALTEVAAELRSDLDPELAEEEERLRYRLNLAERERRKAVLIGNEGAAAAAAHDVRALAGEYRALEARIRNDSPHYAELVQPQPLGVAAVQSGVLDGETLLLQYSLGQHASWLWAVTRTTMTAHRLPPRDEIEAHARRVYELLTARNLEVEGETPEQRERRIEAADADLRAATAALAEAVLGPVAAGLAGQDAPQRLVVAADGVLHYVPFAALPRPGDETAEPLLFTHEVLYVPSASALAALRSDLADREPPPGQLAVLADPVFDADDLRVTAPDDGAEVVAAGSDVLRGDGFRRLRFSRREGEAIADLVPDDQLLTAYDFAASRQLVTDGLLAGYRMVHFATHGVLNTEYPWLSGLVLSLVDETGAPREGFLRLQDIYGLEFRADLVTLSACETALGREIRGEGLVGLARGFMYAGAARVVASLWSVQDRATGETMRGFYDRMLVRGLAPATALREAQIAMARQKRWAAPYYWAPFVLHGEWRRSSLTDPGVHFRTSAGLP